MDNSLLIYFVFVPLASESWMLGPSNKNETPTVHATLQIENCSRVPTLVRVTCMYFQLGLNSSLKS